MTRSKSVHFKRVGAWYDVSWSYDEILIGLIKTFPSSGRHWVPEAHAWRVNMRYVGYLAREIIAAGYEVEGLDTDARNRVVEAEESPSRPVNFYRPMPYRRDIDG